MVEPMTTKDNRGNKIYSIDKHGYEQFWDFDEKNRLTRWHDSNGLETIWEYDELSRPTYMKGSDGTYLHQKYENDCVHQIYSNGIERTYDSHNRLIYEKDSSEKEKR